VFRALAAKYNLTPGPGLAFRRTYMAVNVKRPFGLPPQYRHAADVTKNQNPFLVDDTNETGTLTQRTNPAIKCGGKKRRRIQASGTYIFFFEVILFN
jgi:hypothetical protein